MGRRYKRQRLTAGAVVRALAEDGKPKFFINQGDGYIASKTGEQEIGLVGIIGCDRHKAGDDSHSTTRVDTRQHRFTNPPDYNEAFGFDKIMYAAAGSDVQYGSMPNGTYCQVVKDTTTFYFVNSSFSTVYANLYELCPRRLLDSDQNQGVVAQLWARSDGSTAADSDTWDYTNWKSVGQNEADEQYHVANGFNANELTPQHIGVEPYHNVAITEDWIIRNMGVKVFEPGENSVFKVKRGRYRYVYGPMENGSNNYYTPEQTRVYLMRIWGEPVSAYNQGDTDNQDVNVFTFGPAKIGWTWVNKVYWSLPPAMQFGQTVTGTNSSSATLNPTATEHAQIAASNPATSDVPAGFTPAVV